MSFTELHLTYPKYDYIDYQPDLNRPRIEQCPRVRYLVISEV